MLNKINKQFRSPYIIIAGDMIQQMVEQTDLEQIVDQPTRGSNTLDCIYVSDLMYASVPFVTSTVRSGHKVVIACTDKQHRISKITASKTYRYKSPAQNTHFLQLAAMANFDFYESEWSTQNVFDNFYCTALGAAAIHYHHVT
jgi:hypothetical protein